MSKQQTYLKFSAKTLNEVDSNHLKLRFADTPVAATGEIGPPTGSAVTFDQPMEVKRVQVLQDKDGSLYIGLD